MGDYIAALQKMIQGITGGGSNVQPLPPLSPNGTTPPPSPSPVPQQASATPPPAAGAATPPAPAPPASPVSGLLQQAKGILDSPLTQTALSGYFAAMGSPKRSGAGGMISRGGQAALGTYQNAEANQGAAQQNALKNQLLQQQITAGQTQQGVLNSLSPTQKQGALYSNIATQQNAQQKLQITAAQNKAMTAQFVQAYPNDPVAAQVAAAFANSPTPIDPNDMLTAYQKIKAAPATAQKVLADIAKSSAETAQAVATTKLRGAETKALNNPSPPTSATPKSESPDVRAKNLAATRQSLGKEWDATHGSLYGFTTTAATREAAREKYIDEGLAKLGMAGGSTAPGASATLSPAAIAEAKAKGLTINPDGTATDAEGHIHIFTPD